MPYMDAVFILMGTLSQLARSPLKHPAGEGGLLALLGIDSEDDYHPSHRVSCCARGTLEVCLR